MTPRFGARLIQEHHRLHFLSDRASLVGEWNTAMTVSNIHSHEKKAAI
ncbi:TPA: type IV toxin-antitoxin system YeeU family antitoxin [Aeromonas veronii]